MKITYTLLLVLLFCITGYSQKATSRRALKAYNNMYYAEAADLYQEVVDKTGGTPEELINLAESYLKLNEYIDAELTLEKLFKLNSGQSQSIVLKYAQVLARNERYDEALKYYAMYTQDDRGKNFLEAYQSLNKFYRDSSDVSVTFLPINSLQGEFSPAFYEKGLIFSSNRKIKNGIRRVDGRNQTPFVDLFYLKDTSLLKDKSVSEEALASIRSNRGNKRFDPDYTSQTSNDNPTIGHYDPYYLPDNHLAHNFLEVGEFDKEINSKYHEGPVSFTKNYDTIFFTRNSFFNGKKDKGADKTTRLQIFFATRNKNGKYEHVQSFPFNSADYSVGHPALSPDGKRIYFISDKQGGIGETDIYYCDIREHRFTEPVNVGPVINTAGTELFPSFNKDGSLMFSSDGHAGLGGLDIFRAEITNNEFQKPRNLRFPINSSKDDFGICSSDLHGHTGYLSSNRIRGRADDNIYSFTDKRPQRILVKGTIRVRHQDEDGKTYIEPLQDAVVSISPLGDKVKTDRSGTFEFLVNRGKLYTIEGEKDKLGKVYKEVNLTNAPTDMTTFPVELLVEQGVAIVNYVAKVQEADTKRPLKGTYIYLYDIESARAEKFKTDTNGNFSAPLQPNHTYILKSNAQGYFSDCYKLSSIPKGGGKLNIKNFELKKIEVNTIFEVKNLLYDYNKSNIKPDAAKVLDKVVTFLAEYPEIEVELGSHSDSRGGDEYNQQLSTERANAAVAYIVNQGIDSSRIKAKGYGETQPLNKCKNGVSCTDQQHQENRRTEVKVTGVRPTDGSNVDPNTDPMTVFKDLKQFNDCKEFKVAP